MRYLWDIYRALTQCKHIQIPAHFAGLLLLDRLGRKPVLGLSQLLAGVTCIAAGLITSNNLRWLQVRVLLSQQFPTAPLCCRWRSRSSGSSGRPLVSRSSSSTRRNSSLRRSGAPPWGAAPSVAGLGGSSLRRLLSSTPSGLHSRSWSWALAPSSGASSYSSSSRRLSGRSFRLQCKKL